MDLHGWITQQVDEAETYTRNHILNPVNALRRCEADRRILARHRLDPDAYWYEAAACHGCGVTGDCDDPITDNLNDCPELLDLGHAHGLTEEILASLDRPQRGERPEPSVFRISPPTRSTSSVPATLRGPNWKAPDGGPDVAECAAADRAHWADKYDR